MSKIVIISVIIGIVIIGGIIGYQLDRTTWKKSTTEEYYEASFKQQISHVVYPDNPQFLGPLQINKDKYVLGENVFVSFKNFMPSDKGEVNFYIPNGKRYLTINFDGENGPTHKEYFRPMLVMGKAICDKEQLIGEWRIVFVGLEEYELNFEVLNEILPLNEEYYKGCEVQQMPRHPSMDPTIGP